MSPDAIVSIITSALGIVAAVAPGVLAAVTGQPTDEAAIAAASLSVRGIRQSPAHSAIAAERIAKVAATHSLGPSTVSILSPPLLSIPTESGIDLRRIIRGGPRTEGDEPVLPEDEG